MNSADWIGEQLLRRGITDERVLAAMARVPRERFVPGDLRDYAYDDAALPLAHGQTVSQPYIVAFICQGLGLTGDERVLDVGTGSGYQAAVLAELAAEVHSIYERVQVHTGDGALGLPEEAPFAAIAVAAAASEVPPALWEQLEDGGRIALPLGRRRSQRLCVLERTSDAQRLVASLPVRFVPLV